MDARNRALAVYDRAMQFMTPPADSADVSGRQPGETTLSVWTRFNAVSTALASYLSFAINLPPTTVDRTAVENADDLSDDELLGTIPESERLTLDFALSQLDEFLASEDFQSNHPNFPNDSRHTVSPHASRLRAGPYPNGDRKPESNTREDAESGTQLYEHTQ
jgi:hypothetical protein